MAHRLVLNKKGKSALHSGRLAKSNLVILKCWEQVGNLVVVETLSGQKRVYAIREILEYSDDQRIYRATLMDVSD